jgi:hypothetical protein
MSNLRSDLRWALDPVAFAVEALGLVPDAWQARVLRSSARRLLLLCSRQAGKSTIASIAALHRAVFFPGSLVLVVSPSLRQSSELGRKITDGLDRLLAAPEREEDSRLTLKLTNGSRICCLPASETTIRGFSAASLIIEDESAFVEDSVYVAIRPMLAVSQGRLMLLSTAHGKRGHFFVEWSSDADAWERVKVTANECPRISPDFLVDERRALGETRYMQEYFCSFADRDGAVFAHDAVMAAVCAGVEPWFPRPCYGV